MKNYFEKRQNPDRRAQKILSGGKYLLMGSRSRPRRAADRAKAYRIDIHGQKTMLMVILILILSIADAVFTLNFLNQGARELNPIMNYFIARGPLAFICAKYLLTSMSIMIILYFKNDFLFKSKFRAKILLPVFAIQFMLVMQWHFFLLL